MKKFQELLMRLALRWYRWRHPDLPLKLSNEQVLPFTPKRFLVFANTALGDTLLCTPGLATIKANWPDAHITLFVHRNLVPLLQGHELVDNLVAYHGGFHHFWQTLAELRSSQPDVALLLHSNGPQDIPMAILSGARLVLKPENKSPDRHLLSREMPSRYQHVIEDKLDTLRALGATTLITRMQLPSRYASLPSTGDNKELHIGFQPGAANIYKMWPTERFGALARILLDTHENLHIHILGTGAEQALATAIIEAAGKPARLQDDTGKYRIDELPVALKALDLLISNDTGTMHMGIALGIPTLCLFAPTDPVRIGPYQDMERHRVIRKDGSFVQQLPKKQRSDIAMHLISVDEVLHTVEAMLASSPNPL